MSGNPAALQLRYLQTLLEVGASQNSTIVLPIPIDLIKPLMQSMSDGEERREKAKKRERLHAAEPPGGGRLGGGAGAGRDLPGGADGRDLPAGEEEIEPDEETGSDDS